MDDLRTMINWHLTETCLPAQSGNYYILTHTGMIMETEYSKKYQKFMCSNSYSKEKADDVESDYWMWANKPTILTKMADEHWKCYCHKEDKKNDQTVFKD